LNNLDKLRVKTDFEDFMNDHCEFLDPMMHKYTTGVINNFYKVSSMLVDKFTATIDADIMQLVFLEFSKFVVPLDEDVVGAEWLLTNADYATIEDMATPMAKSKVYDPEVRTAKATAKDTKPRKSKQKAPQIPDEVLDVMAPNIYKSKRFAAREKGWLDDVVAVAKYGLLVTHGTQQFTASVQSHRALVAEVIHKSVKFHLQRGFTPPGSPKPIEKWSAMREFLVKTFKVLYRGSMLACGTDLQCHCNATCCAGA
jgi:hypothetical protein